MVCVLRLVCTRLQVKREQKRAMRLMHMSHKLQAKAAQV
jgi:hypothetical protein